MSSEAVTARLIRTEQLRRLCLELARASKAKVEDGQPATHDPRRELPKKR